MSIRPFMVLLLACITACSSNRVRAQDDPARYPTQDLSEFIRLFRTDHSGVSRFYDLPWSEYRFDRMTQLYQDWQQKLAAVDFKSLNQQGKIDHILLRNELILELRHIEFDRARMAEMNELLPFRNEVQALQRSSWKMETVDPEASAAAVAKLPDQIKKLRERIEKGRKEEKKDAKKDSDKADEDKAEKKDDAQEAKPDSAPIKTNPVLGKRAAQAVGEIRQSLSEWYRFYDGYQPTFSWWMKKPYEEANKALDDYAKFLRETIAGLKGEDEDPLVGDPIGEKGLSEDLAVEMIAYTPAQMIQIADREFAWCEAEMKKASQEMGLGDDWKAALAKVKADHVPPGEQDDLVAQQSRFIIQYLKDKDLVTVPPLCEETWRLTMISPQTQKVLPFAAYGGQNMMVAYPTDTMKHEDKMMSMRGNNKHFTRIVTPHELIPGHHLQGFMAQRIRPYRSEFSTPFFVEGWALYWEMTLWELGYPQTPEDKIGMLFWRMHRAARIIVSLKFHLNQMKPNEMVDFLVDRVGHERFGATSEVRRFIGGDYSPLYQCGYMIGGLELRALRKELVDSGKMTNRQFHDTLLTYGAIPVELIRAGMLNLPLTPETTSTWRFAGELETK